MTVSGMRRSLAVGAAMTVVGAVATIIGTILPWEHIDAARAAAANVASSPLGADFDDGKIFVFVAILTILASGCSLAGDRLPAALVGPVSRLLGNGAALSALAGGYVVCFSVLNLRDLTADVDRLNGALSGVASVGIGIYVDLAAGLVILAGAAIGLLVRRD